MCGRFIQSYGPAYYMERLGLESKDARLPNAPPRFNAAPTQDLLTIRRNPETARAEIGLLRWGLVPSCAADMNGASALINARSETVAEKQSFRAAWRKPRRCVIPADGFYEWRRSETGRQPFLIALSSREPMALAGLWEGWRDPGSGEWVRTFTILTCAANTLLAPLHDRMPVILDPTDIARWLTAPAPFDLMKPYPPSAMEMWAVSTRVNSVRNEGEDLTLPSVA
ncbi:SOS response-associated peptidase [Xanthobacter sp. DSM 24535]|uniref:SOS response-associated peptidase n=1 Tax=Roseixanthobacter psychrophilus TaxID=3119917 RepID=UPI0037277CD2